MLKTKVFSFDFYTIFNSTYFRKHPPCDSFGMFIKNRLQHRCFFVSIAKFLRTLILKSISEWLLLFLMSERLILFPRPYQFKELRNCILRIIRVRSLFCLIRVSTSLHFVTFVLKNKFFVVFSVFSVF